MSGENVFDKILNSLNDDIRVEIFNHDRRFGIAIEYSMTGYGFGTILFGLDKKTNLPFADTECTDIANLTRIIEKAAPMIAYRIKSLDTP